MKNDGNFNGWLDSGLDNELLVKASACDITRIKADEMRAAVWADAGFDAGFEAGVLAAENGVGRAA